MLLCLTLLVGVSVVKAQSDCEILSNWLPSLIPDDEDCCEIRIVPTGPDAAVLPSTEISCDLNDNVIDLTLTNYEDEIAGDLPPSLADLKNIQALYIFNNSISGGLDVISEMESLEIFVAHSNNFAGTIPEEITSLVNLTVFAVSNNELSGPIPSSIANLSESLKVFSVFGNQLAGVIPSGFSSLRLEYLYIDSNQFSGPMPDISAFPLSGVSVDGVNLNSSFVCDVTSASGSSLCSDFAIPAKCQGRQDIPTCTINDCKVLNRWLPNLIPPESCCNGHFEEEDGRILEVQCTPEGRINILYVRIAISLLSRVIGDYADDASVAMPASLADLTELSELYLYNNSLSGPIPDEFWSLDLKVLLAYGNNFTGSLPAGLGTTYMPNLEIFDLSMNTLSGSLPESIGGLQDTLRYFSVAFNHFSGRIPASISKLRNVEYL
ncbi:MAG: hypothetical protein SGCHY_005435 [Lobulomycetales sp.]